MTPHYRYYTFCKRDRWIPKVYGFRYIFALLLVIIIWIKSCHKTTPSFQYKTKQPDMIFLPTSGSLGIVPCDAPFNSSNTDELILRLRIQNSIPERVSVKLLNLHKG